MNRNVFAGAFAIGLVAVGWVGAGFVGTSGLALAMTCVIAAVYVLGAVELQQFRAASATLAAVTTPGPKVGTRAARSAAAVDASNS